MHLPTYLPTYPPTYAKQHLNEAAELFPGRSVIDPGFLLDYGTCVRLLVHLCRGQSVSLHAPRLGLDGIHTHTL